MVVVVCWKGLVVVVCWKGLVVVVCWKGVLFCVEKECCFFVLLSVECNEDAFLYFVVVVCCMLEMLECRVAVVIQN